MRVLLGGGGGDGGDSGAGGSVLCSACIHNLLFDSGLLLLLPSATQSQITLMRHNSQLTELHHLTRATLFVVRLDKGGRGNIIASWIPLPLHWVG